jgi:hypothetical protein
LTETNAQSITVRTVKVTCGLDAELAAVGITLVCGA